MTALLFADGTKSDRYETTWVRIDECDSMHGVEDAISEDHTLVLKRSYARKSVLYQGVYHREEVWEPGSVTMLPAKDPWGCFPDEPYSCTILRLQDRIFVDAAIEFIEYGRIDFRYTDVGGTRVTDIAHAIRRFAASGMLNNYPMLSESLCLSIATETIRQLSPQIIARMDNLKNGLSKVRMRRLVEYIDANIGGLISLTELAGVAGLSPFHFNRSFKNSFGMTPVQFMLHKRISQARRLIASGESLANVAHECSFASQSHLNTMFKRVVGMTPGEYQKLTTR